MPDNNGDQPSDMNVKNIHATGIRTDSLNANQQNVGVLNVTRLDASTGETKSAATDAMNELRISTERDNRNILQMLEKNLKQMQAGSKDINAITDIINTTIDKLTQATEIGFNKAVTVSSSTSDNAMHNVETAIEALTRNLSQSLSTAETDRSTMLSKTIGDVSANVRMVQSASEHVSEIFKAVARSQSISPVLMGNRSPVTQQQINAAQEQRISELRTKMATAEGQEAAKLLDEFAALSATIDQTTKSASIMYRLLTSENSALGNIIGRGIIDKFQGNLLSTIHTLQNWSTNIVDISKVSRGGAEHFKTSLDIAATGAIGANTALLEFIPALTQGADSISSTFALVKYSMSNDLINPIGIMGGDLREVSKTMRNARVTLLGQGNGAINRLSTSASNEAIMGLYDLQRRLNIKADINDSRTLSVLGNQLSSMQIIATNTGSTVDEIIKMNSSVSKQIFDAASAGILTGRQADIYMKAQALLQGRGLTEMASLVKGLAESGGNANLYLSKNPDMATSLSASGTISSLYQLANMLNSATQTNAAFFTNLQRSAAGFKSQTQLGSVGSNVLSQSYQKLSGEAGRAATITTRTPELTITQRLFAHIQDIMTNYIGTTTGLVVSLGANTAALIANTLALGGFGRLGGIIKGLGGSILRMPKKMMGLFRGGAAAAGAAAGTSVGETVASSIGSAVSTSTENVMSRLVPNIATSVARITPTIIQTGGAAVASASSGLVRSAGGAIAGGVKAAGSLMPEVGAIAGATRGLGSMITRSLPVIGTIMGIYDAVNRISNGDILGGLWSGAAGVMATINPLVSAGMYAGLVGRDAYNAYNAYPSSAAAPATTASPLGGYTGQDPLSLAYPTDMGMSGQYTSSATVNNGIRNDTQQILWSTNQALYDLISISQNKLSLLRIIANNTSTGQTEIPTGFFDWLTGTAKAQIKQNDAKQAATYSAPSSDVKQK